MYAAATMLSAVAAAGLPDSHLFHLGAFDVGIPIQAFGVIVATGVLIGAALLRRYAEWHGVSDEHIRELTGWITICGFIGAHLFDVIAYQWSDFTDNPLLLIEVWKGISSFGGFIGGALGFAFYVWWKRLPTRLMADIAIVGLLPAFSIGRIGCTTVSDHVGAHVDPSKWYSFLAVDYSKAVSDAQKVRTFSDLQSHYPNIHDTVIRAWNLGLIELLYLVPVNLLILWLAFKPSKQQERPWTKGRPNAGFLVVLTGVLYAPVRFGLDFLRPEDTDPRYLGLTFAQWAAMVAFGVAVYAAVKIFKTGEPYAPVTRTSGEAQRKLKQLGLKGQSPDDEKTRKRAAEEQKRKEIEKALPVAKAKEVEKKDAPAADAAKDEDDAAEADESEAAEAAPAPETKPAPAAKPAGQKQGGGGGGKGKGKGGGGGGGKGKRKR